MRRTVMARWILCFPLLLVVSIAAQGKVDDEWKKAQIENTAQAYATFLEKYPKSQFTREAELALRRSRLDFVLRSRDPRAMETFIQLYPVGDDTEQVRAALQLLQPTPATNPAATATANRSEEPSQANSTPSTKSGLEPWKRLGNIEAWQIILGLFGATLAYVVLKWLYEQTGTKIVILRLRSLYDKQLSPPILQLMIAQYQALDARAKVSQARIALAEISKSGRRFKRIDLQDDPIRFIATGGLHQPTEEYAQADLRAMKLERRALETLSHVLQLLEASKLPESHPLYQSVAALVEVSNLESR